jgi:hypothetical protein
MAMSYGNVVAQGILGGVMGAARGVAQNAQEEQRIEAERLKEERLSKLRLGEYKAKAEFDQQQKDIVTARDEKDTADFYARTGPQTKASTYTDATGDATEGASAGAVTSERTETAREVADRRAEEARKTGKKGIIEATRADRELEERREERSLDRADRKADREERNAAKRLAGCKNASPSRPRKAAGRWTVTATIAGPMAPSSRRKSAKAGDCSARVPSRRRKARSPAWTGRCVKTSTRSTDASRWQNATETKPW